MIMEPSGVCRSFIISLAVVALFSFILCDDSQESLPYCGDSNANKYLFVSTLDGKVTALNPDDGGSVVWSIQPGSEPMLSSSIHKLELTNYGQLVRMIPSLSGGLYKFNGENIEPIPVTADNLLQSSFRYSDDLVISGGKESQTFGVSLKTGEILYQCTMKGCGNQSTAAEGGDVLVIQRLGQLVRAVEPRSGSERWNFSVAQHDLKLISECHSQHRGALDYHLKVIVPEGLVCGVSISNPSDVLWSHKFDSPVINAWKVHKGQIIDVDLFTGSKHGQMDVVPYSPSLYIGMHEKQLYILESVNMLKTRQQIAAKYGLHLITNESDFPKIPWKPVAVSSGALGLEGRGAVEAGDEAQTTALSVLYGSSYVDGNGYYLYTEEDWKKTQKGHCNVTIEVEEDPSNEEEAEEEETPVQIVIVSLWYWWKEVFVISITTALLFNVMFTRGIIFRRLKTRSSMEEVTKESDSGVVLLPEEKRSDSESHSPEFTSRYLADFDPVDCLGKGGFGVVFKAKKKLDDCDYAVKRIVLPNRAESRDKVMREVKALALLDHHHIVRYFNSWLETPPPGWQEQQDRAWTLATCLSDPFSTTGVSTATSAPMLHSSIHMPADSPVQESSVFLNCGTCGTDTNGSTDDEGSCDTTNDDCLIKTEASDSFIVFDVSKGCCGDGVTVDCPSSSSSKSHGCSPRRPTHLQLSEASPLRDSASKVYLYIQMQLCQEQSLKDWLHFNTERDYKVVIKMFEQIVEAVEYVHLRGLIHRDLKPSNIFFSMDGQIKVGDFGLATTMWEGGPVTPCTTPELTTKERHTAQVGTQLYMSPEQLAGKPYDHKVDIYSLGLILFELLVPFGTQMERLKELQNTRNRIFTDTFQSLFSKEHQLLKIMLSVSPEERPTTYGIKARPPLRQTSLDSSEVVDETCHFQLPTRRKDSSKSSFSNSSGDGATDHR